MGQRIEIDDTTVVGDVAMFDTNRSLTGTDGEGYESVESTQGIDTFPAKLAAELLEADDRINRVYVDQNVVIVRSTGSWTDDAVAKTQEIIEDFFLYYG